MSTGMDAVGIASKYFQTLKYLDFYVMCLIYEKERKYMNLRKYGCAFMIITLVVFVFFLSMKRSERKESLEEMILQDGERIENIVESAIKEYESAQEGEATADIGLNAIEEQEESGSEKEVIADVEDHTLLGNMWMYYEAEEIPFVDEETFAMIREAYGEVEYTAEFETGNPEVYEDYKQKFWRLLQSEVPFLNRKTGKEMYMKDWLEQREHDLERFTTYDFFDINGDGFPELCMDDGYAVVFAYDSDMDQYIVWAIPNGKCIVGPRKFMWHPDYYTTICEFSQLDSDGDLELETLFWAEHEDFYQEDINMVMFPNYADKKKRWEITEEMKQQGVYEESSGQWFFKITDEQFEELEKTYMEAYNLGMHRRGEVLYSYGELFGEYETEELWRLEKKSDVYKGSVQYSEITVNYPQIYCRTDSEKAENANALIKQAAYAVWGNTYEEAASQLEEWQKDSYREGTDIDYEVLHCSNDYISVIFSVLSTTGGPSYFGHYPVSVDLNKGEYIGFYDITSKEQVLDAVKDGKFKVYIGTYSEADEEDFHNPEVLDLLAEELEDSLGKPPAEGFDRFSGWNLGMDEEDIYIRIYLSDIAFHDYVILSIPLDEVTK